MNTYTEVMEEISRQVEKILLDTLATGTTDYIMGDINHILFSHALNEIERISEEKKCT